MTQEIKTTLIVEAITRGFEKISGDVRKFGAAADTGAAATRRLATAADQGEKQTNELARAQDNLEKQTRQATAASNAAASAASKTALATAGAGLAARLGGAGLGAYARGALSAAAATSTFWAALGPIGIALIAISAALMVVKKAYDALQGSADKYATPEQQARLNSASNALKALGATVWGTGEDSATALEAWIKFNEGIAAHINAVSVAIVQWQLATGQIDKVTAAEKIAAIFTKDFGDEMRGATDDAVAYQDALKGVVNQALEYNKARKDSLIGAQQTQNSGGVVTNQQAVMMSAAAGGLPGSSSYNVQQRIDLKVTVNASGMVDAGAAQKLVDVLSPALYKRLKDWQVDMAGMHGSRNR